MMNFQRRHTNNGLDAYLDLRGQVAYYIKTSNNEKDIIKQVKEIYKDEINSTRRFEDISNVIDLLKILEKRNCLSINNATPLRQLAERLDSPLKLLDRIIEYEKLIKGVKILREPTYYDVYEQPERIEQIPALKPQVLQPEDSKTTKNIILIYEILTSELGSYWRDFARFLGIREGEIDSINEKYSNDLKSKIWEVLKLYEYRSEPVKWQLDLCKALEKCRRSDLRDKVNEIMIKQF